MRRNRFLVVAFALTLSCAGTTSLPKPGEIGMKPFSFRMRDFKVPSGLRIIVQEDHSAPVAGVVNVVGAGSSSDPTGKEGIAHFLEHMAFRMKPFKDNEATMWELLPRSGVGPGSFNAGTGLDTTTYYEFGPKEALPQILRLEGARMVDPERGIDQKVVDTEREVVRNELRERGETAFTSSIIGWMQQALFPEGHPYHRPGIGTHESLSNIKLEDIQKFAKVHYRLDNMTLFIIGDIDLSSVDKLLAQNVPWLYGDPNHPTKIPARLSLDAPPPPESPKHDMYTYDGPVQTPEIWIGWSLPGGFRPDSVFYTFVAGFVNASLFEALQEDRDIVGVGAFPFEGVQATMLICQVRLREGAHPEKSAEHVLNQLYKVWAPTTDATTDRIAAGLFVHERVVVATAMALESEDITSRAENTAVNAHFNGDPLFFSHTIKALTDLEQEKIQQYAYKYLTRDRARMLYVKPLPPTARATAGVTGLGGMQDDGADARVPDYTPAQARELVKPAGFSSLKTTKLKNGLELVIAKHSAIPAVTVQLGVHGGQVSAGPGLVRLAGQVARPWSKRHNSFSDYGAQSESGANEDQWEQQIRAGSGNLPNVLAILNDQLSSMAVPSGSIDQLRKYVFPFLKKQQERPEAKADRAFWKALFGDHPYGQRPTIEEIEKHDSSAVESWIKRAFAPRNAVMAIVGDVEPDEAVRLANEWLGEWTAPGDEIAPPQPPAIASAPIKILVTHRPAATQGELTLGCLLPPANPKNAVMYRLMTGMVSDHLFKAVRGKLGASYGMHPGLGIYRGGAAWMTVSGNINNSSLGAAFKVIKEYWDSLPYGDFTDKEMNRVRYEMALGYNMHLTTSDAIASEIVRVRNLGWPLDSVDQYGENLASITKDEMRAAFKTCHEAAVLSIVGDEETVRKALKEADWK